MKMVMRADDVGYTKVHNVGTFEAVDNGIVTACDVMLDTPGTVEALQMLKERPWISTGWHTHFWGAPVLDPADVPTMYDAKIGHFRRDLSGAQDVSYDECLAEMRAQMDRCISILGKPLDVILSSGRDGSPFQRAMTKVVAEYGLETNFGYGIDMRARYTTNEVKFIPPAAKWADKKIYVPAQKRFGHVDNMYHTDSITEHRTYDPLRLWFDDETYMSEVPEDGTLVVILHPGYVDYYVAREGSQTERAWNFLLTRCIEAHALCSDELKDWLCERKIELVNFRDALYGTQDYQNHLRFIGSKLCMK